jgi:hypothetical protein
MQVFYVADNLVRVSYKENALGHTVRYIKLVKSRFAPPSERCLFDFLEGVGLVYIYLNKKPMVAKTALPEDASLLGVEELYRSQIVGVYGADKKRLAEKLEELAASREVFYLSLPAHDASGGAGRGQVEGGDDFSGHCRSNV